jgi:hypothetical protein
VTPTRWAVAALTVAALAACGTAHAADPAPVDDPTPALTIPDTATLTAGDTTASLALTLTCRAGYNAYGSAAITDNDNAGDLAQPQGYTGPLTIPCTGQPQAVPVAVTSSRTPFREGAALARAAFTLNLCDPNCRYVYIRKAVTNVRAAGQAPEPPAQLTPRDKVAPGEAKP